MSEYMAAMICQNCRTVNPMRIRMANKNGLNVGGDIRVETCVDCGKPIVGKQKDIVYLKTN